jgi:hypothetical protein
MKRLLSFLALAMITFARNGQAEEQYPAYKVTPVNVVNAGKEEQLISFVESAQILLSSLAKHEVFLKEVSLFTDVLSQKGLACGTAEVETGEDAVRFVETPVRMFWDVSQEGWAKMGCNTPGASLVEQSTKRGEHTSILIHPPLSSPKPAPSTLAAAVPPAGPLPFGVRQRIAAEFEDTLSQVLGAQVLLLSDRVYKEQDGSETSCTVGTLGRRRFRLAERGDEKLILNPSNAQWQALGCTRPGYQLIR